MVLAQICIESLSHSGFLKGFSSQRVLDIVSQLLLLPTPTSRHLGLLLLLTPKERKTSQPENDHPKSDTKPRSL